MLFLLSEFEKARPVKPLEQEKIKKLRPIRIRENKMKKVLNYLFIMALALSTAFMSCKKDYKDDENKNLVSGGFDGKITATMENGSELISKVKAIISNYFDECVIASGDYSNDGFTLNLPSTVPYEYLESVTNFADYANVSNYSAKYVVAWFECYDSNDKYIGEIVNGKEENNSQTYVEYWYVDNDVMLTGGRYSMSLNKGWNRVYYFTNSNTTSTKPIDGLKWYIQH